MCPGCVGAYERLEKRLATLEAWALKMGCPFVDKPPASEPAPAVRPQGCGSRLMFGGYRCGDEHGVPSKTLLCDICKGGK